MLHTSEDDPVKLKEHVCKKAFFCQIDSGNLGNSLTAKQNFQISGISVEINSRPAMRTAPSGEFPVCEIRVGNGVRCPRLQPFAESTPSSGETELRRKKDDGSTGAPESRTKNGHKWSPKPFESFESFSNRF